MSHNPTDPFNPYSSPGYSSIKSNQSQHPLVGQFKLLGIMFIILASIGFIGAVLASLGSFVQLAQGGPKPPPNMDPATAGGYYVGFYGSIIGVGLSIVFQPLILWAGINMLRLKGRGIIMTGAVVAMIPMLTSCCVLGIPFGIWALVLLMRPDSKSLIQ